MHKVVYWVQDSVQFRFFYVSVVIQAHLEHALFLRKVAGWSKTRGP